MLIELDFVIKNRHFPYVLPLPREVIIAVSPYSSKSVFSLSSSVLVKRVVVDVA